MQFPVKKGARKRVNRSRKDKDFLHPFKIMLAAAGFP
jgi:hypothetical protein